MFTPSTPRVKNILDFFYELTYIAFMREKERWREAGFCFFWLFFKPSKNLICVNHQKAWILDVLVELVELELSI